MDEADMMFKRRAPARHRRVSSSSDSDEDDTNTSTEGAGSSARMLSDTEDYDHDDHSHGSGRTAVHDSDDDALASLSIHRGEEALGASASATTPMGGSPSSRTASPLLRYATERRQEDPGRSKARRISDAPDNAFDSSDKSVTPVSTEGLDNLNFDVGDIVNGISRQLLFELVEQHGASDSEREKKKNEGVVAKSNDADSSLFDVTPLIKVFEDRIEAFEALDKKLESSMQSLETSVAKAHDRHATFVSAQRKALQLSMTRLKTLDQRVYSVGNKAVRIGTRMEAVDFQRTRAAEVAELIGAFIELNTNGLNVKAVFSDPEKLFELAPLARRLNGIVQDLDIPRTAKGKNAVEKLSHEVERQLLERFAHAAKQRNYERMQQWSQVLFEFNGGMSCIRVYLDKMVMFAKESSLAGDRQLANVIAEGTRLKETVDQFFVRCEEGVLEEYDVICNVFPEPDLVMHGFIQRLFRKRIKGFIDDALRPLLESPSTLQIYLQGLCAIVDRIREFAKTLQQFHTRELKSEALIKMALEDYRQSYFAHEIQWLTSYCESELKHVEKSVVIEQQKKSTSLFGKKEKAIEVRETVYEMRVEIAIGLLHANQEAIDRCVKMIGEADVRADVAKIYLLLCKYLGTDYLLKVMKSTLKFYNENPATSKSHLEFFELVSQINTLVILIQKHFHTRVSKLLEGDMQHLEACRSAHDEFLHALEARLVKGLDRSLRLSVAVVSHLLKTEQKKSDFRLKDDEMFDPEPTQACQKTLRVLTVIYESISRSLDGENLVNTAEEFGRRLQRTLIEHIKDFPVSVGFGGMKLKADLGEYRTFARRISNPDVDACFDTLVDVANVHIVDPKQLKMLIDEMTLTQLSKAELVELVKLRSDFKRDWIGKLIPSVKE